MSTLTEILEQMQIDAKDLKIRVDKIEPREIDLKSKKSILDLLEFDTDAGTAQPVDANLDVLGGTNIDTAGAGNVVTINGTAGTPAGASFIAPAFTFGAAHVIGALTDVVAQDSVIALGITAPDANTVYPNAAASNRWSLTSVGGTVTITAAVANTVNFEVAAAGLPFAVPALTFGAAHAAGAANTVIRSDAVVALGITCPDANTVYPLPAGPNRWTLTSGGGTVTITGAVANQVNFEVAAAGLPFAVPNLTLGVANAAGAANSVIRSDATILVFDAANPTTIQCDDAAVVGVATVASRRDHQHAIVTVAPVNIGNANAEGAGTSFVRSTHVHNHPAGLGVNLHHNEVHVVNSTGPHAEAGLTIGHVLRASGAAAFSFAALIATDLPAHNILSAQHGDSLTANVVDGDVIIGNVTPAWSRLAIAIPGAGTRNVLGIDNAELRPSWKTAVYSVALTLPGEFSVAGSPITGTGTLAGTWVNQAANLVFSGPAAGGAVAPTFRALVAADLPAAGANWTRNAGGWLYPTTGTDHIRVNYDADVTSYMGRAAIGWNGAGYNDFASFSHIDQVGASYCLLHSNAGATFLNAANGQTITFLVNSSYRMTMSATATNLYRAQDFAMYDGAPGNLVASIDGATGSAGFGHAAVAMPHRIYAYANGADVRILVEEDAGSNIAGFRWRRGSQDAYADLTASMLTIYGGAGDAVELHLHASDIANQLYVHATGDVSLQGAGNFLVRDGAPGNIVASIDGGTGDLWLINTAATRFGGVAGAGYLWPAADAVVPGSVLSSNAALQLGWVAPGAPAVTPWTDAGAFLHPTAARDVKGDGGAVPGWELFAAGGALFRGAIQLADANTFIQAAAVLSIVTDLPLITLHPGGGGSEVECGVGYLEPTGNNVTTAGRAASRWSNVYSVLGNFSGTIIASQGGVAIASSGDITMVAGKTVDGVDISAFKVAYDAHVHVITGDVGVGTNHSHATSKATITGSFTAGAYRADIPVYQDHYPDTSTIIGYVHGVHHWHDNADYAWTYVATAGEAAHTHDEGTLVNAAP